METVFFFFFFSSSISECIPVYFHAVTSKDLDPEKDSVILKSEKLFGNWETGWEMTFSKYDLI